jgi:DNA-binding Lrp family transcriptional regulator
MNEHRWSKFWWADWRTDAALRLCGYAARGLWIDMLSIMHEAGGYLVVNGRAPTPKQIAQLTGGTEREVMALLRELEDAGVFSRTDAGVIYSRRMVRDAEANAIAREHGKRGGNPKLKADTGGVDNGGVGGGVNPPLNPQAKPGVGATHKLEAEAEAEAEKEPPSPTSLARPPRGCRLPPDWVPSEADAEFATGLGLRPGAIAAQFRDYWHAKTGKDATKLDWSATWRGWCRREAERAPNGQRAPPRESKTAYLIRDMMEEIRQ